MKDSQKVKSCSGCQKDFPISYYTIVRRNPDGLSRYCKGCSKLQRHAQYVKYKDRETRAIAKYRELHEEHLKQKAKEYVARNKEKIQRRNKRWYEKNKPRIFKQTYEYKRRIRNQPERRLRVSARNAVYYALTRGYLTKQPCEVCRYPKVQAHHYKGYDHAHKLIIKWLCTKHHGQAHAKA